MGRKPTRNRLPPGVRARHRGAKTYYFLDVGGKPRKEISLGSDFVEAMRKWSELSQEVAPIIVTFKDAADKYTGEVLPKKKPRTQRDNLIELEFLMQIFNAPPVSLDDIKPVHLTRYIRWRMQKAAQWYRDKNRPVPPDAGHVRANREIALFSAIFNYAREIGLTDRPNPVLGVRKNKETGRDTYVEDDMYQAVWNVACQPLRDAMDLAYLTGQRPADTLQMSEHDIRDGFLHIQQGKTDSKLRIQVIGELADVIGRIRERKAEYKVVSTALIVNESGMPIRTGALRDRFDKARQAAGVPKEAFQFRDLRAKAGTDKTESAGDIRQAQKQLGHVSVTTTERYVRNRKGDKVGPTR
jgi:integrase